MSHSIMASQGATKAPQSELDLERRTFLGQAASVLALGASGIGFSSPTFAQSAATPAATSFSEMIGVGVHFGFRETPYVTNFEHVAELLKDIGIKHIRDDAIFSARASREYDSYQRIRVLVGQGFRFDLVCQDPLNGYIFVPPRRLADIFDWCDQGVEMFEGANEPNLLKNTIINPAISADHQRSLYAAVKGNEKLKNIPVASPSYIFKNVEIAENLSDSVDYINIHPYPGMEHPETKGPGALAGFIPGMERVCGKKPVVVTETGYHTALQTTKAHLPVSEDIKTRYYPRLLLWNFLSGVKKVYIYEFVDSFNHGPTDPESHFGLVDFTGNPKPSFNAVKQLLSLCRRPARQAGGGQADLKFNVAGDTRDLQTASFRRDDGTYLVFLWLGVSGWNNASRTQLAPVTRQCTLKLSPGAREVKSSLFQDDGTLLTKSLGQAGAGLEVTVSDQLTALEITV